MKALLITLCVIIFAGCDGDQLDPMPAGYVEPVEIEHRLPETYVVKCMLGTDVYFNQYLETGDCRVGVVAIEYSIAQDGLGNYIEACRVSTHSPWQAKLHINVTWPKEGVTIYWRPVYIACGDLIRGETRELNTKDGFCQDPDWNVCE